MLSGTADAGDESVANLLRDVVHAEVAREIGEVRDIVAAERRATSRSFDVCIDCGAPIGHNRLEVISTAKRCGPCQEIREKNRGGRAPSL